MTLSSADIMTWIGSFAWPFLRFSAMLLVSPFFGARAMQRTRYPAASKRGTSRPPM